MIRRPPRSTLFPTRRSSDLGRAVEDPGQDRRLQRLGPRFAAGDRGPRRIEDRKSTRLNSSHTVISYAVFCLKKKKKKKKHYKITQRRKDTKGRNEQTTY